MEVGKTFLKSKRSRAFRKLMFSYSVFEMLFCSGPIFGWASLAYVLKKEDYFSDLCLKAIEQNDTIVAETNVCAAQENRLNFAYTIGCITVGVVSFPVGYLLDLSGPKKARYISSALFGISSAIWINFSIENQYLIYPAVLTLSAAGVFSSFAFFQVSAFLCHNHQSTVLGLQNGAFNASAVIFHIIKILCEVQKLFRLEVLLALYCGFSAILVLLATSIFVPSKEELVAHAANRNNIKGALLEENIEVTTKICVNHVDDLKEKSTDDVRYNEEEDSMNTKNDDKTKQQLIDLQMTSITKDFTLKTSSHTSLNLKNSWSSHNLEKAVELDNLKLTTFNIILHGSKISIDSFVDVLQKQDDKMAKPGKTPAQKESLVRLLISGIFLWHVFFASIFHLRQHFFVTTFESLLKSIPGGNEKTVNNYINILGIGQFIGVIFAPVLGPYIDRSPKLPSTATYEDYRMWKIKRCAVALRITCTINIIMGISVLIPVLQVQILAIAAQILLRGFFYAVHFTYFAAVFPPGHYGKLTCLALLMGVLFGSLQYPLCIFTEQKFDSDPFWVNVGLLIVSLVAYGQTFHLARYVKRQQMQ